MKQVFYKGEPTTRFVTIEGRVFLESGEECKQSDNGAGYLSVALKYIKMPNGKFFTIREYVHRVVARHFLENPESYSQVNHKDCNKSNNHVDNLEWISPSENINHSHASGRMQKRYDVGAVTYLTTDEVRDAYSSVLNGEGVAEVARRLNRPRTTISSIVNKRSRRDITDLIDMDFESSLQEAEKLIIKQQK